MIKDDSTRCAEVCVRLQKNVLRLDVITPHG